MVRWSTAAALSLAVATAGALAPTANAAGIGAGPSQPTPYEVFTIGDSYASGEGAPDSDGVFDDSGSVQSSQFEDWDTRFGGSPAIAGLNQDSTRCHRSGHTSTSAVAVAALQNAFPDLSVDWQSVACSGAAIVESGHLDGSQPANKGGILRGYDGVDNLSKRGIGSDKLSPAVYPSQIGQLNTIISNRPAGPRRNIDALVMDLGGNDLGFGDIIADCTNILPFKGPCNTDDQVAGFVSQGLHALNPNSGNGRYDRLAASLDGSPLSGTGDPSLNTTPHDTFLTAAPNPLRPTSSTFCDQTPKGGPEEQVTAAESSWVTSHVADPLNTAMRIESTQHDWTFVDSYLPDFVGHAICTAAPNNWINTNLQGLRIEGRLDGLPPFVNVSAGIVHPNAAGYADMGAKLADAMAPKVVERFTPQVAPDTTITSSAAGFGVVFDDSNLPDIVSGYWHKVRVRKINDDGTVSNLSGSDGNRAFGYTTSAHTYSLTGRYMVTVRACAPLSRDGSVGCSPPTAETPVSTFTPATPTNVSLLSGIGLGVPTTPSITVNWKYADALAVDDTRTIVVRLKRPGGGKFAFSTTTKTIPGPASATVIDNLTDGQSYTVTVQACNDGDRCSDLTDPQSVIASTASQFSGVGNFQATLLAKSFPACSTNPVAFDPGTPGGAFGISDPFSNFTPTCIGGLPVGRIALRHRLVTVRRGRAAKVQIRWRHPRRWRDLREVDVRLADTRGVRATLRFDNHDGRIVLARGTRKRGSASVAVGHAGTLRAGGLTIRLARTALKGSGARGHVAALRFSVLTPRSLAIAVGATDESGVVQPPVPAGAIRVR
jgi:hypothetical protein